MRGAFRNAVVWGVVWGAFGFAVSTVFRIRDQIPFLNAVGDGLGMGIRIGIMGAITSAAFSTFIYLRYRGKLLSEISWKRFGVGGALVAGAFVPAFMQTMNYLSGQSVPWNLIFDDIVRSAVFGGITAAGTMWLAQRAEAKFPPTVPELLGQMEQDVIGAGQAEKYSAEQRTPAARRF